MTVSTRRGDDGNTDTFDGRRISKTSLDIELIGSLDETNSFIGHARAQANAGGFPGGGELHSLQKELYELMGAYSVPATLRAVATRLLPGMDERSTLLQPLADRRPGFIVPGDSVFESALHLARTVCRRTERIAVRKAQDDVHYQPLAAYLNRLSDVMFLLALQSRGEHAKG